jgi:tRNA A-37 threonylcarbamoyl transferase component Bud32
MMSTSTLTEQEKNDMKDLATLSRKAIESRFDISGKKGKEGVTFVATGRSGTEYAIKLFKAKKSSAKLSLEASRQTLAAAKGVSPRVMAVNTTDKYIIMEKLEETIVDFMRRMYPEEGSEKPLSVAHQHRIIEICEKLDQANVVQNDGNPLNLMMTKDNDIMIIDFGFARDIDKKMLKKRGPEPNIILTLWHIFKQLRFYKIMGPLLGERIASYTKELSDMSTELPIVTLPKKKKTIKKKKKKKSMEEKKKSMEQKQEEDDTDSDDMSTELPIGTRVRVNDCKKYKDMHGIIIKVTKNMYQLRMDNDQKTKKGNDPQVKHGQVTAEPIEPNEEDDTDSDNMHTNLPINTRVRVIDGEYKDLRGIIVGVNENTYTINLDMTTTTVKHNQVVAMAATNQVVATSVYYETDDENISQ